jgi:hypothetical protein
MKSQTIAFMLLLFGLNLAIKFDYESKRQFFDFLAADRRHRTRDSRKPTPTSRTSLNEDDYRDFDEEEDYDPEINIRNSREQPRPASKGFSIYGNFSRFLEASKGPANKHMKGRGFNGRVKREDSSEKSSHGRGRGRWPKSKHVSHSEESSSSKKHRGHRGKHANKPNHKRNNMKHQLVHNHPSKRGHQSRVNAHENRKPRKFDHHKHQARSQMPQRPNWGRHFKRRHHINRKDDSSSSSRVHHHKRHQHPHVKRTKHNSSSQSSKPNHKKHPMLIGSSGLPVHSDNRPIQGERLLHSETTTEGRISRLYSKPVSDPKAFLENMKEVLLSNKPSQEVNKNQYHKKLLIVDGNAKNNRPKEMAKAHRNHTDRISRKNDRRDRKRDRRNKRRHHSSSCDSSKIRKHQRKHKSKCRGKYRKSFDGHPVFGQDHSSPSLIGNRKLQAVEAWRHRAHGQKGKNQSFPFY